MTKKDRPQPKDTTPASDATLSIALGYLAGLVSRFLPDAAKPIITLTSLSRPTEQEATDALKKLREIGDRLNQQ